MSDFRSGVGNFDSPQNAFLAGQVAMEMQGPFLANFIYHRNPAMSTVLWPKDTGGDAKAVGRTVAQKLCVGG